MASENKFLDLPADQIEATKRFYESLRDLRIYGPSAIDFGEWHPRMEKWPPAVGLHFLRTTLAYGWRLVITAPDDEHTLEHGSTDEPMDQIKASIAAFLDVMVGTASHPAFSSDESADVTLLCDRTRELPFPRQWRIAADMARILVEWVIVVRDGAFPDSYFDETLRMRIADHN